ncbi:MAG: hypothetical protein JWQ09_3729 [Segetibacter sp.]|nr:hypothetical protein [Segetibacter sp.]
MKTKFFGFGGLFVLLIIAACNNGTSTTNTDSTTISTDTSQATSSSVSSLNQATVHLDPSASYVELKTGKPVKLRVDTVTKYIVNEVTNEPVMYYINPATNDTFDRSGRLVNRALIRNANGDYSVDETRITVSTDDNSNMTSSDTTEAGAAGGNSKTKIKDDKFKQKTDTSTIKVKEGKVKVKTKPTD